MEEAHRMGLMLPSAAATAQIFNALVSTGMGEDDSISALKLLELKVTYQVDLMLLLDAIQNACWFCILLVL